MNGRHPLRPYVWLVCVAVCLALIYAVSKWLASPPDASVGQGEQPRTVNEPASTVPPTRDLDVPLPSGSLSTRSEDEPPGAPGPSDGQARLEWLLSKSLQEWGKKNPLAATKWAVNNLSAKECWSFLGLTGGIAFELGAKDMQQGLLVLQELRKYTEKADVGKETVYELLMQKFAAGAVASDPEKAIRWAREFGSLYMLAGHWADLDAQKATQWARSLTDAEELDAAVTAIASSVARRGRVDDLMNLLNSLTEKPKAYNKAVTTMLQSLPEKDLGPMLKALQAEPPSDAEMASSWISGLRENFKVPAARKAELLSQLATGLGERWRNNPQVKSALEQAVQDCAKNMWQPFDPYRAGNQPIKKEGFRDAVNYLATGGGGIIPAEVRFDRWSPLTSTWLKWCQASPSEAVGWLRETGVTEDQRRALVGNLNDQAKDDTVAAGTYGANYKIALDNQGVFRITRDDRTGTVQQFTYTNGQWEPPLPKDWEELKKDLSKFIKERQNLQSALQQLSVP